jgi:hypothetical protein
MFDCGREAAAAAVAAAPATDSEAAALPARLLRQASE